MHNFLKGKNEFLLRCQQIWNVIINLKKSEKVIRSEYQRATSKIPLFLILHCFKNA